MSFGISGPLTELLEDRSYRIPPLGARDPAAMTREIKAAPMLFGYRGSEVVDIEPVEDLISRVAQLQHDLPQISSLELSLVLAGADHCSILTARARVDPVSDPRSDWFVRRLPSAVDDTIPGLTRGGKVRSWLPPRPAPAPAGTRDVVERTTLRNGLRVVLLPDASAPVIGVAVYYDVGIRSEPEGRTGFAHLFEHLMFQGSASLGKMEHIRYVESSGGWLNGSTRLDYTNYYEALPGSRAGARAVPRGRPDARSRPSPRRTSPTRSPWSRRRSGSTCTTSRTAASRG